MVWEGGAEEYHPPSAKRVGGRYRGLQEDVFLLRKSVSVFLSTTNPLGPLENDFLF